MVLLHTKTGATYKGELSSATGLHGRPDQCLVLRPERGGRPLRLWPSEARRRLILLEATLDEVSRLDRAGYYLRALPRRAGRRRKR